MFWTLQNQSFSIRVARKGAELQSLYSRTLNREYLWQPGAETWNQHSLLLFPNAGRISRDRVFIRGREYPMTMHGFAKDSDFTPVFLSEDRLTLCLTDTPESLSRFPCPFSLTVDYRLEEDRVVEELLVKNPGTVPLSFGLGLHPGFYCPIDLEEGADDYLLRFDTPQNLFQVVLDPITRLCTHERRLVLSGETDIPLFEGFFDKGPFPLENCKIAKITLLSKKSGRFLEMGAEGFPVFTFWGNPGQISLICIEPWCGRSDDIDSDHIWEHKPGNVCLSPGETWSRQVWYRLG